MVEWESIKQWANLNLALWELNSGPTAKVWPYFEPSFGTKSDANKTWQQHVASNAHWNCLGKSCSCATGQLPLNVPSGKLTVRYWKRPSRNNECSWIFPLDMVIFQFAMLNYQRVPIGSPYVSGGIPPYPSALALSPEFPTRSSMRSQVPDGWISHAYQQNTKQPPGCTLDLELETLKSIEILHQSMESMAEEIKITSNSMVQAFTHHLHIILQFSGYPAVSESLWFWTCGIRGAGGTMQRMSRLSKAHGLDGGPPGRCHQIILTENRLPVTW